jgi:methionine-rich copper-binding protein CopC
MRTSHLAAALSFALAASVLLPNRTYAHAKYDSSNVPAGASIPEAPRQIRVCYTEDLDSSGSALQVVNSSGARVDLGNSQVDLSDPDRRCMLVGVQPLPAGSYTVTWHTLSAKDGHDDDGSYNFSVTRGAAQGPLPGEAGGGLTGGGLTGRGQETSLPVAASGTSDTVQCAQYSGRAAQPYFNYAQALASGMTLPGIPPAQAVTPQYAYGPGPAPGTLAMGPYRPIYPYPGRYGPGAVFGGVGATNPNPQLTARGLTNAFLAGGQLTPFPNGTLAALTPDQIIALGGNQAADVANQIAVGDSQQGLVANQLGYSDLRYNWVQTYLQMTDTARQLALSLCGRIP